MKKILILAIVSLSFISSFSQFNTYYGGGLYFNSKHVASGFGITADIGVEEGFEICLEGLSESYDSKFDYGVGMDLTSYGDLDNDPLSSVQFGSIYLTGRYYLNGKQESTYFVLKIGKTYAYNPGGQYTWSYDPITGNYYDLELNEGNFSAFGLGWNLSGRGSIELTKKVNKGSAYDPLYGFNIDVEHERISLVYLMRTY